MSKPSKLFKLPNDEIKYLVDSYNSGELSSKDICAKYNLSQTAVLHFLKKSGAVVKPLGKACKYTYDLEFIKFLIEKGYDLNQIAIITMVPYQSIVLYAANNKLKTKIRQGTVTPFQLEMVIDKYKNGATAEESVKGFDISGKAVMFHINKAGIQSRNAAYYIDPNREPCSSADILENYKAGMSIEAIQEKLKVANSTISKVLSMNSVVKRTRSEMLNRFHHKNWNTSAFTDFDNDESAAYFYGFLLADGCLSNNNKTVSTVVKTTDIDVLYKLKSYLNSDSKVCSSNVFDKRTQKTYHRSSFDFSNTATVDRLILQGFAARKSCKEQLPAFDWLNNRHFWRGCIDGDGYLNSKTSTIVFVGSNEVVSGFLEFVKHNIGLKTQRTVVGIKSKNEILHRLTITGEDARNTIKYLYKDAKCFLDRKYNISQQVK